MITILAEVVLVMLLSRLALPTASAALLIIHGIYALNPTHYSVMPELPPLLMVPAFRIGGGLVLVLAADQLLIAGQH